MLIFLWNIFPNFVAVHVFHHHHSRANAEEEGGGKGKEELVMGGAPRGIPPHEPQLHTDSKLSDFGFHDQVPTAGRVRRSTIGGAAAPPQDMDSGSGSDEELAATIALATTPPLHLPRTLEEREWVRKKKSLIFKIERRKIGKMNYFPFKMLPITTITKWAFLRKHAGIFRRKQQEEEQDIILKLKLKN